MDASTYNAADQLTATSADTSASSYDGDAGRGTDGITAIATSYNDHGGMTATGTATYSTFGAGSTNARSRTDAGVLDETGRQVPGRDRFGPSRLQSWSRTSPWPS
ncbi:MAG: hypothetical protein JWP75_3688 [Frondihabitans sp.]|nr:hypothetical protein [Frondihabitans sp.]